LASKKSQSPARQRAKPSRIRSTFACDIAYSRSPAAPRASAWSQKNSKSGDLALANRVDARHLPVRCRRPVASDTPDEPHDYAVGGMDEVTDRFRRVGIPGFAIPLDLAKYSLPPGERPRLGPILRRPPNHVRGEEVTPRFHVPSVKRLEGGPHDLDVVLRHRPPSIRLAVGSASVSSSVPRAGGVRPGR
jgi:hypothetical protein